MRFIFTAFLLLGLSVPAFASPARDQYRRQIREWVAAHARPALPTIAPADNDLAANMVDTLAVSNLAEMEAKGLLRSTLPEAPWSGFYWPTYVGQIADRYADPGYTASLLWQRNHDYLAEHLGDGDVAKYSPAEKYDLLVGDADFTLSKRMIEAGAPYVDEKGQVPTWFGLCHGWAPASFMLPRPAHSVTAQAADGTKLSFTPDDLKALASLLWANGSGETRFVGSRCNEEDVGRDDHGRETNPACFDSNPATWHLSVVNQIGVSQRSFVMDASAGYEVWNQPVVGYSYGYVNPNTREGGYRLADAKVPLADLRDDQYSGHRAPGTAAVVGVVMSVIYVGETTPGTGGVDGPRNDAQLAVTYSYDLELDERDGIIGGEWHTSVHPDFLWVPVKGATATSVGDAWLSRRGDRGQWDLKKALPAAWRKAAKQSAGAEQPLARVVHALFRAAQP